MPKFPSSFTPQVIADHHAGVPPKMSREFVRVTAGGDDEIGVSTVPEMLMRSDTPLDFANGTEHAADSTIDFKVGMLEREA